jgi:hypothetical protein|tara:strand:- start:211 stop:624 length:414 start_codon:yes stop_codon:yes gene_type:complete
MMLYAFILVSGAGKTYNARLYDNVIDLERVCGYCDRCKELSIDKKWVELANLRAQHFNEMVFPEYDKMIILVHHHREAELIGAKVLGSYKTPYEDFLKICGERPGVNLGYWKNQKEAEIKTQEEIAIIIKQAVYTDY